jgi:hypothetical protein
VSDPGQERWLRVAGWFLAISYGIGAPVTAIAELRGPALSEKFGLPSELIYLTCAIQLASSPALLIRPLARWPALALTIVTVGAIGAHLYIGSPLAAVPALFYTAVQIWFGVKSIGTGSDLPPAA